MELGIKGHETRGDEVIKILEMLGGKNRYEMRGSIYDNYFYYIDDEYKDISYSYIGPDEIKGYKIFSLEDFLEKFPYKIGDKVTLDNILCSIIWIGWECNNIYYQVQGTDIMFTKKVIANELKPYKGKNTNMNDDTNEQSECEQCGRVFGSVKCFDVDCPHNTPNYAVGLMDDKVNGDENLFHTTDAYEEIVEKSFQGGYEKCKSEMNMNDNNVDLTLKISTCYVLPDGYHFTDENGNVIDVTKILIKKNLNK